MEKKCSKCKEVKPLTEFHKNKKSKDGHKEACKVCRNKENAEYKKRVPQKPKVRKYVYVMCEDCSEIIRKRTDQLQDENRCKVCANKKSARERTGKPIPSLRTGEFLNCDYCETKIYKSGSQIYNHNFCGRNCYDKWQKENFDNPNFIRSADNRGENNGRYKHGKRIGGHDRHKELKTQIIKRDGEGCLICESKDQLHVHRIIPGGLGGEYELNNTVQLCKFHHAAVHEDYEEWKEKILKLINKK